MSAAAGIAAALPAPALATGGSGGNRPGLDVPGAYVKPRPSAMADPTELTLAEAAWMIRDRRISPLELTDAYLARITAFDATYLAFNTVLADAARDAAKAADRHRRRGPLHGIPLAIKDNYYTRGVPTTANSFLASAVYALGSKIMRFPL